MLSDPHPDLLRPIKSDDFLPAIGLWTNLGSFFLVGAVGAAVTLAAVIKYNVTVKAPAVVRPTGKIRLVQATTQGTVKSIKVKENQLVKRGDAIAFIDDSQLQTKKSQLQGNIQLSLLQIIQITAQISQLDSQIAAQSQLMNRTLASAQADLTRNQRDYRDRQITTIAEVREAEAALELAQEELKRYHLLGNTGVISPLQIKEKEQAFKAAVARLQRTKAGLNPSDATVAIAQEKIAQEKARGESTRATLNEEREELIRRQIEIKNQIHSTQKELKQVNTELQKTIIQTNEAGRILKLSLRNPGQLVCPGDAIAQIAPSNTPLVIKAHVAAQDIGKVRLCKAAQVTECFEGKVQLRVSAYPYPDYGTLKGAVRAITADAITPQTNTNTSAAPYYEVTIQPEKLFLEKGGISYPIQPGMEVTSDIIAKEETVLTFILRKARLITDL
ncbi:MAG: HlyD family efflux transporter periplasmic adaptor subunit [Rhizonema sp. PD38]|nr:HlyD family efflux transporter periplasmic adaptor subunit [Rhizonema sp. PD38]